MKNVRSILFACFSFATLSGGIAAPLAAGAAVSTAPAAVSGKGAPDTTGDSVSGLGQRKTDLYVSTSGADSNAGTEALPLRTIGRAAQMAGPGSTVHVAPGLYIGSVETRSAGRRGAPVRYISIVKWGARVQGHGKNAVWVNRGDYAHISGFDLTGSGRIGILNFGSHTLIEGNHVHHLAVSGGCTGDGGAGIDNANYAGSDGDIVGNVVHDIGTPGSCNGVHGIYSSNQGGRIVNNLVYRVSAFAIHLWHAATRVTVAHNTLFANGSASMGGGIILGNGDGPGGAVLDHTKIINNIIYDNPGASITEFCYPGHECTGAHNTVANNLIFNNGHPISLRHGTAKNTVVADPKFIDYRPDGGGNYQLQSSSPALANGVPLSAAESGGFVTAARGKGKIAIGASIQSAPFASQVCAHGKSKTGT